MSAFIQDWVGRRNKRGIDIQAIDARFASSGTARTRWAGAVAFDLGISIKSQQSSHDLFPITAYICL